jgi:hypothetical protein
MRVLARLLPDDTTAWYLQASVDVPTGFESATAATRVFGVLGLDYNARGVAWTAVKPDGNRLVQDGQVQTGFLRWALKGLTEEERKQAVGTMIAQLMQIAQRLSLAVAVENLDFGVSKAGMKAGRVNKSYNNMLGSLATAQFTQMMQRACEKAHRTLYLVNPAYSSVGGFAKYGRANRMNADTSAALWIGRQAVFGTAYKTDDALCFVKKHDERLVFSHLAATLKQSKTALSDVQWKDVAWALGKNRALWGEKFRKRFLCRVEAASALIKSEPGVAFAPTG